ncbi:MULTISPECIES: rhodanese-like domain-containing protein [unclassified Microbacterium]|uniref:rhodanese-like domain-containing protein n=1 Tax=unclassified Microbacterium TaxID=2609290 RepID=UPI003746CC74
MKSITVHQLRERDGVPLIDVREVDEFAAGHVPGAVNLPMSSIGEHLDQLPDGSFDVICQVGGRSSRVVEALTARGHDATNVDGGTGEWIASGYPVERVESP